MRFRSLLAAALCATAILAPPLRAARPFRATPAQQAFAEDLSRRTFAYFWETTDARTCMAPDRWPSGPVASIAAIGFALTAYGVGAERGYVPRDQAAQRTRDCLKFLLGLPQGDRAEGVAGHKGFFYHFLDQNGLRFRTNELSTVDTSLLFGGVLFAQSYYDRETGVEREIRDLAERLYRRADWTFFQRNRTGTQAANLPDSHGIAMGWRPESGYEPHDWVGYNEGMLVYVLAVASPTHPVGLDAWTQGWAKQLDRYWAKDFWGQSYLTFEPLFGHQYSHVWIDFRGIRDPYIAGKGIDYFENSRRATLAQKAYGQANPAKWVGYGGDFWGWTASDGPGWFGGGYSVGGERRSFFGYAARGVSPEVVRDDGTIVPTAPGGSIAFAPEIAFPALMAMKARYGDRLYTRYGFKDAFNPSFTFTDAPPTSGSVDARTGWVANDHLGIDQGPILAMLENHRSGLIWRTMRRNTHIRTGLTRLGFTGGWLDAR